MIRFDGPEMHPWLMSAAKPPMRSRLPARCASSRTFGSSIGRAKGRGIVQACEPRASGPQEQLFT
jgi:hypothetical protein